ncbi:MAG TPA: HAD hydrolase-like protein [Ktedonobacterales bacterium]|jgi:FMN phosphatase YigB (HAD superfamily)
MMKLEAPQAIRTIFFDAGFTLLRPSLSLIETCQDVCQREGVHLDSEQLSQQLPEANAYFLKAARANPRTWASEEAISLFWRGYYKMFLRPFIAEENEALLERCAEEIIREFDQHTHWELYPDALPTLQALEGRGFTLGIISDWGVNLAPIISSLNLPRYFDCLVISAVSRYSKPEAGLYDLALQRASAIPDYAIHIGDSYIHDVLGARTVGITPILIDRPGKLRAEEVDCVLIRDLREVLDLLEIPTATAPIGAARDQQL